MERDVNHVLVERDESKLHRHRSERFYHDINIRLKSLEDTLAEQNETLSNILNLLHTHISND